MARNHARLLTRIWRDPDFRRLPESAQFRYLFLLSQPNLNHAGVLPLTFGRWANSSVDGDAERIAADLELLHERRFIVLDRDSEELLIRTFVINDDVYKAPRVMGSMVASAQEIVSPLLRAALLAEIGRVPVHELSEAPTKRAPFLSVRVQVVALIAALREAFGESAVSVEATSPAEEPEPRVSAPQPDVSGVLRYPAASSDADVPDWLAPLVGAMREAGIRVPWSFKDGDHALLEADVERVGLRAMFAEAVDAYSTVSDKPFSSRWFYPRWHALEETPGGEVIRLRDRRGSNGRQAQVDEQQDEARRAAMAKRAARLAAEAQGSGVG